MADLEPGVILSAATVAAMERLSTSPRTTMTEQHRATPEQWADAGAFASDTRSCLLELRDRVAALEAAQQPRAFTGQVVAPITGSAGPGVGVALYLGPSEEQHGVTSDRLIARDTPAPASSLIDRVATDAELCKVYNGTPGFGPALRAVYDLGRQHGAAPIRSGPESPLLDRVADAIAAADDEGLTNMTWSNHSRAAIFEVAAWFRTERAWPETAAALEQEANR